MKRTPIVNRESKDKWDKVALLATYNTQDKSGWPSNPGRRAIRGLMGRSNCKS